MKYCPNCGTQNQDDAVFCIKCGYKFPTDNWSQTQNTQASQASYQQTASSSLGLSDRETINTILLIAFIFSIIAIFVFLIETIGIAISIVSILADAAIYHVNVLPELIGSVFYIILFIVMFITSILVFFRTREIYGRAKAGDYATAYKLDSLVFGVIALILAGVITGILLIIANLMMEKIVNPQSKGFI
mgnify:CR=1 FL=1